MRIEDLGPKDVVHCDTEEKANKILKLADKAGKTWICGERFLGYNRYYIYGSETCYNFNIGQYANKDYYIRSGFNIISADQILNVFHPGIYWHHSDKVEVVYLESVEQMEALPGYCELVQRCEKPQSKMVKWTPSLEVPKEFWVKLGPNLEKFYGSSIVVTETEVLVVCGQNPGLKSHSFPSERIYVQNS